MERHAAAERGARRGEKPRGSLQSSRQVVAVFWGVLVGTVFCFVAGGCLVVWELLFVLFSAFLAGGAAKSFCF